MKNTVTVRRRGRPQNPATAKVRAVIAKAIEEEKLTEFTIGDAIKVASPILSGNKLAGKARYQHVANAVMYAVAAGTVVKVGTRPSGARRPYTVYRKTSV